MQTLISAADDPARIDARGRHASWTITWWQRSIHQDILRQYRGRYRKQEHEHLADIRQIPVRRGVGVTVRPLCKSSMIDWLIDCLVDSVLFENISSIKDGSETGELWVAISRPILGCSLPFYRGHPLWCPLIPMGSISWYLWRMTMYVLCLRVIPCCCSCSEIQDQAMNGNQRTMELRDKLLEFLPAMSRNLSFYDVAEITKAYQCTGRHRGRTIIDRSRELFISPVARRLSIRCFSFVRLYFFSFFLL